MYKSHLTFYCHRSMEMKNLQEDSKHTVISKNTTQKKTLKYAGKVRLVS